MVHCYVVHRALRYVDLRSNRSDSVPIALSESNQQSIGEGMGIADTTQHQEERTESPRTHNQFQFHAKGTGMKSHSNPASAAAIEVTAARHYGL